MRGRRCCKSRRCSQACHLHCWALHLRAWICTHANAHPAHLQLGQRADRLPHAGLIGVPQAAELQPGEGGELRQCRHSVGHAGGDRQICTSVAAQQDRWGLVSDRPPHIQPPPLPHQTCAAHHPGAMHASKRTQQPPRAVPASSRSHPSDRTERACPACAAARQAHAVAAAPAAAPSPPPPVVLLALCSHQSSAAAAGCAVRACCRHPAGPTCPCLRCSPPALAASSCAPPAAAAGTAAGVAGRCRSSALTGCRRLLARAPAAGAAAAAAL